jgi:hypothetical protein
MARKQVLPTHNQEVAEQDSEKHGQVSEFLEEPINRVRKTVNSDHLSGVQGSILGVDKVPTITEESR